MECTCYVGKSAPPCPEHRSLRERCQRAVFEVELLYPHEGLGAPEDRYLVVDAVLAVVAEELTRGRE